MPPEKLVGNFRYDPDTLEENLIFGSPTQVVDKLKMYEGIGVDSFMYYASMGMDMDQQKRSLRLFIEKVVPHFSQQELANAG